MAQRESFALRDPDKRERKHKMRAALASFVGFSKGPSH